ILLEVAYFDPHAIRKSRKQLGFVTEASQRFEKGADPNGCEYASARVAYLLQELCGGEVAEGIVDCYPEKIEPRPVTMRPDRCRAIMGADLSAEKMAEVLKGLEFEVSGTDPITATAPTFRHDIEREIDLIEEVTRMVGFDAIEDAIENVGPLYSPDNPLDQFENQVRRVCTAAGFDEIMGHGLADSKQASLLNPDLPQVKIVNPVSEDLDIMRNDLLLTSLAAVSHNLAHRNLDLRLFEIGRAYFPPTKEQDWHEDNRLALLVSGNTAASWRDKPRPLDLHDLTGVIDRLATHFAWPKLTYEGGQLAYLEPDATFEIVTDRGKVGWLGSLNPKIAKKWDIKQPVYFAQLLLEPLQAACGGPAAFEPLPSFPAAPRDLALLLDQSVRVGDVVDTVAEAAGELAESVHVFDLYTGKQVGEGKKSVGISITYRSAERSLSSDEVDAMQQKVVALLKDRLNADVRDR
ncbi:hypothetical protein GF377_10800, partial [candidate division GN15 bacterium]|nr:hypothetical protein [candidate division GN15 bacterium]